MSPPAPILAIGGPTATGKTALAVELATRLGAELVNADSRQLGRRLHAGTATPTEAELRGARCHLLDECEPGESYTVARWSRRARAILDDLELRGVPAIVVGGTGQYLRALRRGWDFGGTPPDPVQREALDAEAATPAGLEVLVAELRARDPEGAAHLDLANPRRVVRAVELLRAGRGSLDATRRSSDGRALALVVLDAQREVHDAFLEARVASMFAGPILGEVRAELARGTAVPGLRRAGIGYAEAIDHLDGRLSLDAARALALRRTRRYAKAQRTWFRHEPTVLWLERGATTTTAMLADAVIGAIVRRAGSPP